MPASRHRWHFSLLSWDSDCVMRIAHIITRMIIGGAQENTLYNCRDLIDLLSQSKDSNVPVAYMPHLQRAISPWQDLRAYYEIKNALRKFQPQVVHTHSAKAGVLGRLAAASLKIPAIVHTVHGAPYATSQAYFSRLGIKLAERYAAKKCHKMISVANAMTDFCVTANIAPREKFVTIYSGMEVTSFLEDRQSREVMRPRLGYRPEHIVIGKIARLFPLKGHDDLLTAAQQVIEKVPQVRFLLVGDGILRPQLEQKIHQFGLQEHVKFAGLVPPAEIPSYLSAMDILVHTSLREGLARALPQALLTGIPIVSYDIDGAREVCRTGETGVLVPARDITQLTNALVELASDVSLRHRLGTTGQTWCRERFDHAIMTASIRQVYENLLSCNSQ
jgi:glycosyltransferase involved in cell wall biosynthesis